MAVEGFDPLPDNSEPPDALEELRLQDALAEPTALAVDTPEPPAPFGRGAAYDFAAHALLPGVAGGPLMTRGLETLAVWLEKCSKTRRGENPAVDPGFGCDLLVADLLEEGAPFDESLVAEYVASLERAFLMHPRVTGIEDIQVTGGLNDDAVQISYRVLIDGDPTSVLARDLTFDDLTGS